MLFLLVLFYLFMRQLQAGGGKAMSFGKSRARLLNETQKKVTFADVAGIDEAKDEVEEIIAFLQDHNLYRINLARIAWRMKDKDYFQRVTELLAARHAYDQTLWSYGIYHDVPAAIRQYLAHSNFANQCGDWLDSELLGIDPVVRRT